jgi:hypothetical protein
MGRRALRGTGAVPADVRDASGRQPVPAGGMRATVSVISATRAGLGEARLAGPGRFSR